MKNFLAATLVLASGVFVSATPVGSPTLNARACSTAYPAIARVDSAQPVASYLPGFVVSQDAGAKNKQDAFAEFIIPAGSYGCSLEAYFPAGYPISSSGKAQVYVYTTDKPLSFSPRGSDVSWAYSPQTVSQVGTVTFTSDPAAPKRIFINSFACQPKMTYRFSISRDSTAAGAVSFQQTNGAGLRMTYNC
ncbi:hypothetical protein LTR60_003623 [Cryomyces antarcticus]|nr:hypothetical protein LTR60_003623 [Cryomyces antarcticus]